jgi:hypothetical protein
MRAVTLDTGVLIGIERRDRRVAVMQARWIRDSTVVTVPAVVVAEWWRGQKGPAARILDAFTIEPMSHTIDAIVMASAASRGDVLYTSDFEDLSRLQAHFASVRVLAI